MHKFKRNDIVGEKRSSQVLFGRVVKRIDENHVLVIDCGKYVRIYSDNDLEHFPDYKGYWHSYYNSHSDPGTQIFVFHRMPTLRYLKQMASRYKPFIWKKKSRKRRIEEFIDNLTS